MNKRLLKYVFLGLALIYLIFPYDVVPDFFGILGRIEDILLLGFVLFRYFIGQESKEQAKQQARTESRSSAEGARSSGDSGNSQSNRHQSHGSRTEEQGRQQAFDPYQVLGVSPGASSEEITAAYRREAARYHPDKVSHLGAELQALAHQKMLDIQKAYAQLKN